MSIKYNPPKIISFIYEGENESDSYSIKYDEEKKEIYFREGMENEEDSEWYAFPLDLLAETVDFINGEKNRGPLKTKSKLGIPKIQSKEISRNEQIEIPSAKEIAKSSDDNETFESFSQSDETIETIEVEKVIEEPTKEEMIKRPVLDGNMSVEMSASVRGSGDGAQKRTIRRS